MLSLVFRIPRAMNHHEWVVHAVDLALVAIPSIVPDHVVHAQVPRWLTTILNSINNSRSSFLSLFLTINHRIIPTERCPISFHRLNNNNNNNWSERILNRQWDDFIENERIENDVFRRRSTTTRWFPSPINRSTRLLIVRIRLVISFRRIFSLDHRQRPTSPRCDIHEQKWIPCAAMMMMQMRTTITINSCRNATISKRYQHRREDSSEICVLMQCRLTSLDQRQRSLGLA